MFDRKLATHDPMFATLRKATIAAVISSVLLGAVAVHAEPWMKGGGDIDGDGYLSQAELAQLAPTLSASFGAMDVNNDQKLTRGESRSWHESLKASMVANDTGD